MCRDAVECVGLHVPEPLGRFSFESTDDKSLLIIETMTGKLVIDRRCSFLVGEDSRKADLRCPAKLTAKIKYEVPHL